MILITGGGGSIGSELCRQLISHDQVIAFDVSENSLFHLQRELPSVIPAVGSIRDARRVREVLERYRPSVIFHAAAHKHVPLMEDHIFEAVENNVLGTWTVLKEAAATGVSDFILLSSDKAVRPSSVMGMTKRIAERLVTSFAGPVRTAVVRFGNVLGTNGSVLPIFQRQVSAGGPVTVTHPEMERYFISMTDAAELILEAAQIMRGGEIFLLDMGDPVKILDLAETLIGGRRIEIEFTGIRPGEKMREELHGPEEKLEPTSHKRISVTVPPRLDDAEGLVAALRQACEERDMPAIIPVIHAATMALAGR